MDDITEMKDYLKEVRDRLQKQYDQLALDKSKSNTQQEIKDEESKKKKGKVLKKKNVRFKSNFSVIKEREQAESNKDDEYDNVKINLVNKESLNDG